MFAGVVIKTFNRENDKLNLNGLLNLEQRSWILIQNMTYNVQPRKKVQTGTGNFIRDICIRLVMRRGFDNFVMACILANTIVLALKWFD